MPIFFTPITIIMKSIILAFAILLTSITGCATQGISKNDFYAKSRSVSIGMTKGQFYEIFQDAVPRGARQYPGGVVEVLEVGVAEYHFLPTGQSTSRNEWTGMESHPEWFYFFNNRLAQYGKPNDWPERPDLIIETRSR
jgi:hypothetical protein